MPLSTTNTTIIFYTCHYLPPTPLSYSIHATIYHQHHYHIICINTNFQHSPSSWFEDIFHSQLASQLIKLLLV
ncbi:hypothetical protein CsSME_00027368 [Camellia sinensis var. sinensis]